MIDPWVSVPIANGYNPAETPLAEPADDPLDPCEVFHGFLVWPPNQPSFWANSPSDVLATSTAPAASSFSTTAAVTSST